MNKLPTQAQAVELIGSLADNLYPLLQEDDIEVIKHDIMLAVALCDRALGLDPSLRSEWWKDDED